MTESIGEPAQRANWWVAPLLIGAAVSVALGVFGRVHKPAGEVPWLGPFETMSGMKVWLTVVVLVLAVAQLFTALWMYGKLGLRSPSWLGKVHRTTGALALLTSLPVAAACLWALGFQTTNTRRLVHGLLGCVVYGAFAAKVLVLRSKRVPGWALPVVAGLLFAAITTAGLIMAIWYFKKFGAPH